MSTKTIDNCQLEIDRLRGVLYVHSPDGMTLVRVCQIPLAVIDKDFIDAVYDQELARVFPAWKPSKIIQKGGYSHARKGTGQNRA